MKIRYLMVSLIALLSACNHHMIQYDYQVPDQENDGLTTGSLQEVNMDMASISKAVNKIRSGKYGEIHSMLIYKDGRLVLEEYFSGHDYQWEAPGHHGRVIDWGKDSAHCAHSVSKSITSICTGIAIDKGFISDVNQSIFDYLPQYKNYENNGKEEITIAHLLTMTSGLQWAEWNAPLSSRENDAIAIWFHPDGPINFTFQRPMVARAGQHFTYSGGNIELLGEIIHNASGMRFDNFSRKYLFKPMGIGSADWKIIYPTGEVHAAAGLWITPRDMVKIGVMMLNKGMWNNTRILSEEWVEKSENPFYADLNIKIPNEGMGKAGYSYTWWTKEISSSGKKIKMYLANGWGGQKIVVIPGEEMVIVFTGANYTSKIKEYKVLRNFILPSLS